MWRQQGEERRGVVYNELKTKIYLLSYFFNNLVWLFNEIQVLIKTFTNIKIIAGIMTNSEEFTTLHNHSTIIHERSLLAHLVIIKKYSREKIF